MKTDVKAKWLEALRSGEYEQGKRRLRSADDEFCCLGVLCDLAVKEGVIGEPTPSAGGYVYDDAEVAGLSAAVQKWSGVEGGLGQVLDTTLAFLNDRGKTFAEIADIVEREL